ncbi:MAG: copper amine oxidase N-terminal domain-containing protein [Butyricicoccus sp.]|nr:copper amine oxidase N-terminal domain-containing protein [Butyricicoccus sp.]
MKKLIAIVMSASMVCGASIPAVAADTVSVDTVQNDQAAMQLAERVLEYGTIVSVSIDTAHETPSQILIRCPAENDDEILLQVDASTILLDSGAGTPGNWADLKPGDSIYAFHASSMTTSIPPQTAAEAIVYNVPQDAGCAMLYNVGELETTDDGIRFLTTDGSMYISANQDTAISSLYTKERVTLADIQRGDRVFAWYDAVLESYPGQTYATKLVLIRDQDAAPVEEKPTQYAIALDHDMVLMDEKAVRRDDVVMVPMRVVAETLGCTVTWDEQNQAATMTNDTRTMTVHIGTDRYVSAAAHDTGVIGMTSPTVLGCAPYVDDAYRTWIPVKAFQILGGYGVTIDDSAATVEIYTV